MARKKMSSEEWAALEAEWTANREEMARLLEQGRAKLAAQKAAQAEWEARRARRAARIHRILTLGLGRAA